MRYYALNVARITWYNNNVWVFLNVCVSVSVSNIFNGTFYSIVFKMKYFRSLKNVRLVLHLRIDD